MTAPIANVTSPPKVTANGAAMGIIILNVPHEVPVEKDMMELSKKMRAAKKMTERFSPASVARYSPVFSSFVTLPIAKAKSKISAMGKSFFAPLNAVTAYIFVLIRLVGM